MLVMMNFEPHKNKVFLNGVEGPCRLEVSKEESLTSVDPECNL